LEKIEDGVNMGKNLLYLPIGLLCMEKEKCVKNQKKFERFLGFLILITIIILSLIMLSFHGSENTMGSPQDRIIKHEIRIENLTYFTMNTSVELYSYEEMNASELRHLYNTSTPNNQSEIIADMEISVLDYSLDVLKDLFNGSYAFYTIVRLDRTTLDNGSAPDTPIRLKANSTANLSKTSYDLPDEADLEDVIYGTLNMGAVVKLDLTLKAPAHSNTTFMIYPPPGTVVEELTSGDHGQNHSSVTWVLLNGLDSDLDTGEEFRLRSKAFTLITDEDIRVTMVIDRVEFELTTIHVDLEVYAVEVGRYGNLSSSIVKLDYISADGIRMVMKNGLLNWSWERIYQESIRDSEVEIEEAISESLNVSVEMNFSWDNSTLNGYDVPVMGTEPPVRAWLISDDVVPQLYAIGNDSYGLDDITLAKGFLNAGGKADFDIPEIDLDLWVSPLAKLKLSPNMRLEDFTGVEDLETDNRYSYTWDPRVAFHGRIISLTAKKFTDSRVEVDVTIDIKEIRIKWFALRDSSIKVDIVGDLSFYRIETPGEILEALPDGISIDFIIADVLRLVYDTGLIDLDEINDIIDNETEEIERELRETLEENVFLSIEIDEDSLLGYDIDDMKDTPPVRIRGLAHISIPIAQGIEGPGSGDVMQRNFLYTVLKEITLDFPLDPLEDWTIHYKLILPKGISITDVYDDLGLAERGTIDGRHYISVTITDQPNNLTVTVGVTPMFFINLCMLPIAIILLIIVLLISRRRSKKRKRKEKERQERKENLVPGSFQQLRNLEGKLKDLEKEKTILDKKES